MLLFHGTLSHRNFLPETLALTVAAKTNFGCGELQNSKKSPFHAVWVPTISWREIKALDLQVLLEKNIKTQDSRQDSAQDVHILILDSGNTWT